MTDQPQASAAPDASTPLPGTLGAEARRYLRARHGGVLSTLSQKLGGYPFGSVVPFVLDAAAQPVMLISQLAEHTRNLAADARASLIATDASGDDMQAAARLTVVADAAPVDDQNLAAVQARYLRFFPDAARLLELGDFRFWVLRVKTLRFIGGFGRIHWVDAAGFAPPPSSLANAEASILAHMNADHAHNLAGYCRHFLQLAPAEVEMVGIDCDGMDLRADGGLQRIDFARIIHDAAEARAVLVEMAAQARGGNAPDDTTQGRRAGHS